MFVFTRVVTVLVFDSGSNSQTTHLQANIIIYLERNTNKIEARKTRFSIHMARLNIVVAPFIIKMNLSVIVSKITANSELIQNLKIKLSRRFKISSLFVLCSKGLFITNTLIEQKLNKFVKN